MTALVLDAHLASALAAVRSLGKRGIRVICGSPRKTAMGFYSKYCSENFLYISPRENKEKFVDEVLVFLRVLAGRGERAVVFSMSDETFLPLAEAKERLAAVADFALADQTSIETAFDKGKTLKLAEANGVPVPKTFYVESLEEAKSLAPRLSYPAVIKPRHSCVWQGDVGSFGSAVFAASADELASKYEEVCRKMGEPPLIQEVVRGEELGAFFLFDHGAAKARFAHRRLRSISPHGGASVLRESIRMPENIEAYSLILLQALNWHGPAMVEFKMDERDNIPKLMEINGRFWGSLALAVRSGVDFPYLYFRLAREKTTAESTGYREGVKVRHLVADVKHLLTVLLGAKKIRGLAYPGRLKTVAEFFRFTGKDLYYDVEALDDLKPFFAELVDSFFKIF